MTELITVQVAQSDMFSVEKVVAALGATITDREVVRPGVGYLKITIAPADYVQPGPPRDDEDGIRQVVKALLAAGYIFDRVDYGGGDSAVGIDTEDKAVAAITAVDDCFLVVNFPLVGRQGWVRFVLGNEPEEVVCDYTTNLSDVIEPVTDRWWS